jgi:hypothetical protein
VNLEAEGNQLCPSSEALVVNLGGWSRRDGSPVSPGVQALRLYFSSRRRCVRTPRAALRSEGKLGVFELDSRWPPSSLPPSWPTSVFPFYRE